MERKAPYKRASSEAQTSTSPQATATLTTLRTSSKRTMKLTITAALVMVVSAAAMPDSGYPPKNAYKAKPMPYDFAYGVQDPYQGIDFGRNEKSDGNQVQGSYSVQLPDGRKQTVNYRADHDSGFYADVTYEGKAQYPPKSDKPPFVVAPSKGGGYSAPQPSYH
ncbi:Insect cuticle protein [Trinorchestia longiramus]|nr:Insect cuticle protein [Trinorchestia longiramus]